MKATNTSSCQQYSVVAFVSYLVLVAVKNGTHDTAFASLCFAIVAMVLCGGAYHIFNKLYNVVPKSERERIKAEKQANLLRPHIPPSSKRSSMHL